MAVDYVGMDVHEKFCDSRSNNSGDIRGADFVLNEQTNVTEAYHIRQKSITGISPKNLKQRWKSNKCHHHEAGQHMRNCTKTCHSRSVQVMGLTVSLLFKTAR